jgi:hypothetical protein
MPEKKTIERARQHKRARKSASTQAGEFVKEVIHDVRKGKHGARSTKQAIAIGLSQARRAGVDLPAPKKGKASQKTRRKAQQDLKAGHDHPDRKPSAKRSRASHRALEREGTSAASHEALSRQATAAARKRTAGERSEAAKKAALTKGPAKRHAAAVKAARTRAKK